jgi:hypothetical protein
MTELAYDYFNASAVAAPACVAANGDAPWRCLFGTEAISYVQSPYLLVQSQFDRAQLMYNAPRPGSSAASVSYANAFQAATREMLSVVPTATQPRSALFAPACFSYCTSLTANFWNVRRPRGCAGGGAHALTRFFASLQVEVQGGPVKSAGLKPAHTPGPASMQDVVNWWFFKGEVRHLAAACGNRVQCSHPKFADACLLARSAPCASWTTARASGAVSARRTR